MAKIDPAAAAARTDLEMIDVRTPGEYASGRAPGARNIPLQRLQEDAHAVVGAVDGPVALVCASGARAEKAREALVAAGCEDVFVVDGGMQGWRAAGGEVLSHRNVWSMERQVRTAAGAMVLLGAAASFAWAPAAALPAFVGAGLVFAGVTDTCGMALLLGKMPWNTSGCNAEGQPGSGPVAAR